MAYSSEATRVGNVYHTRHFYLQPTQSGLVVSGSRELCAAAQMSPADTADPAAEHQLESGLVIPSAQASMAFLERHNQLDDLNATEVEIHETLEAFGERITPFYGNLARQLGGKVMIWCRTYITPDADTSGPAAEAAKVFAKQFSHIDTQQVMTSRQPVPSAPDESEDYRPGLYL